MNPFSPPWKHQKTLQCFQGVEKRCIGKEWIKGIKSENWPEMGYDFTICWGEGEGGEGEGWLPKYIKGNTKKKKRLKYTGGMILLCPKWWYTFAKLLK